MADSLHREMTVELQAPPELWPVAIDWDLIFSCPPMRSACAYWQSLCQGRRMPERRELDPRAMKEFVCYVNLIDVSRRDVRAYDYTVSLQCNHARDVLGNVEKQPLSAVLAPVMEERWRNAFDLPCINMAPVRLTTRASTLGKHWLECEILLAPLGHGDDIKALFWVFVASPVTHGSGP